MTARRQRVLRRRAKKRAALQAARRLRRQPTPETPERAAPALPGIFPATLVDLSQVRIEPVIDMLPVIETAPQELERQAWAMIDRYDEHLRSGGKSSPQTFQEFEGLRARFPRRTP